MKALARLALAVSVLPLSGIGHDLATGETHGHYDFSVAPPGADGAPVWFLAQADTAPKPRTSIATSSAPAQVAAFEKFAPAVKVRWDERFLFVESNGLPAHDMMVGITAWQQQVPLPQNYTGTNAWQIPLSPVPAKEVVSIKNRFLRGAIALAANGIPIFNPQNNRGEVSAEIGELDQWGGHCGRADDYHYHAAPLHLQSVLGKGLPIAYALDGYPIYGLTEPDGAAPTGLDAFNGHTTAALGYHYHASTKYPYVNGGFHGEVVEREEQVDPQPHAQPVRPALQALRGAKITGFEKTSATASKLSYDVNGDQRAVLFALNPDGSVAFEFQNGRDGTTKESYTRRERGAGQGGPRPEGEPRRGGGREMRRDGERPPREGERPPREEERERPPGGGKRGGGGREGESASTIGMDAMKKPLATFKLSSPAVGADGRLPAEFTGDGAGITPPLAWSGAPLGTKSFAIVMDHLTPDATVKSYWVMWDLPANTTSLPKAVSGRGRMGASFKGLTGYEPPHSQGPGEKTYVVTVYALSAPPQLTQPPREVTRDVLLTAIKDRVLASDSTNLVYARTGEVSGSPDREASRPRRAANDRALQMGERGPEPVALLAQNSPADRRPEAPHTSAPGGDSAARGERRGPGGGGERKGGGKGGPPGLIKPTIADTMKLNVYADNWFMLYVNGRLVAVDPIQFTPHNVVSVDFLPEYPMTIAVLAKDNADPKTGLEYGTSIGDGGFILKFADGTVTNATWKAKSFFTGPLGGDTANPRVTQEPLPANWWAVDFDDRAWPAAREFSEQEVNPKQPYYDADFAGAKFIWSQDLALDNTVIFRTRIEKPGWTPRWNTKPDLDVTGAPLK